MIIHKNPTEESFVHWMSNFPESFHPCDAIRFEQFVKTIIKYRVEKWLNYEYFCKRITEKSPSFQESNIVYFYEKLRDIYDRKKIHAIPIISISGENKIVRRVCGRKICDKKV